RSGWAWGRSSSPSPGAGASRSPPPGLGVGEPPAADAGHLPALASIADRPGGPLALALEHDVGRRGAGLLGRPGAATEVEEARPVPNEAVFLSEVRLRVARAQVASRRPLVECRHLRLLSSAAAAAASSDPRRSTGPGAARQASSWAAPTGRPARWPPSPSGATGRAPHARSAHGGPASSAR